MQELPIEEPLMMVNINALMPSEALENNLRQSLTHIKQRGHANLTMNEFQEVIARSTYVGRIRSGDGWIGYGGIRAEYFASITAPTLMFLQYYTVEYEGRNFSLMNLLLFIYSSANYDYPMITFID